jgi:primosomal protein N' (replication factor Y)
MYYRVIPFKRTFDTYGLVYSVPIELQNTILPGKIIVVPFRDTQELALCVWEVVESDLNCKTENIKDIISIQSDFIFMQEQQLDLINFVSTHYITPIHHALWLYFPRNLIEKVAKNTIDKIKSSEYNYTSNNIILSPEQELIYKKINGNKQKKHLIYGVTGSGKTQIYMKIIADNLVEWKQTLLLIPEIILTSQIGERVKHVFGQDVIMLHSGITAAKKSKYWMDIHSWNAKIVIWTRSSLFYPYNNLWAIIIDEEHDSSYISDQAPRYHSLDIAEKLSQLYNIPLILGSGTPRATTFYRALQWDFQVLQLLQKFK